jgi:hypothetical protein
VLSAAHALSPIRWPARGCPEDTLPENGKRHAKEDDPVKAS